jgi:DNA-binding transcriptional ArsR family regulator
MSPQNSGPDQSPSGSPQPDIVPGPRELTDARTMRALAHPVRIALLEALGLGGAMTATELGERIGESPTTCSFHLRQLAKYGFVEEAGGGKGRSRPWRISTIGMRFSSTRENDPEYEIAASALGTMFRERQLDRFRTWQETMRSYPRRWQDASDSSEYIFFYTVEELESLSQEMNDLLLRRFNEVRHRMTDLSQRPPGSVPVELLLLSFPMHAPPPADADADAPGTPEPGRAE